MLVEIKIPFYGGDERFFLIFLPILLKIDNIGIKGCQM